MRKRETSRVGIDYKDYKTSEAIMKSIHDLRKHGVVGTHAYVQLLVGPTGVGKSALLQNYASKYPPKECETGVIRPVLYVEAPQKPTTKGLAEELLRALEDEAPTLGTEGALISRLVTHIVEQEVELIIVDEGQQLTSIDGFVVGNFFKQLLNKAKRPIVISGLMSLLELKELNTQFKGRQRSEIRMAAFDWHSTREKKALKLILNAMEAMMMFDLDGFHLEDDAFAERLAYGSRGLLRQITNVILEAEKIGREDSLDTLDLAVFVEAWRRLNQDGDPRKNPFTCALPATWDPANDDEGDRELPMEPPRPKQRRRRKSA